MSKVIILSGVSGSGKSTLAKKLKMKEHGMIVSADYFFMKEGKYNFDVSLLEQAHKNCFSEFVCLCSDFGNDYECIIVDNTNLQNWEMAAYITYANYVGAEVQIIRINSGLTAKELAARNLHGVPEKSIQAMMSRIEPLPYPWKKYEVKYEQ